jgi:hypothetical protein
MSAALDDGTSRGHNEHPEKQRLVNYTLSLPDEGQQYNLVG